MVAYSLYSKLDNNFIFYKWNTTWMFCHDGHLYHNEFICNFVYKELIMRYEPKPHGDIGEGQSFINPWFNLVCWTVIILCIWYNQSHTIKKMTYKHSELSWEKPMKIEMSFSKKGVITFKCLIIDIKNNPHYTFGCCAFLAYLLVRCFI